MALDFPANPVDGQAYNSYIYNASVGAWQSKEDPATVATVSTTPPASGNPGDIWYDSDDGTSYVYYNDGTSGQWVELLSSGLPLLNTKADLTGATFTGNVTAPRLISTQATGTSPLQVTSTTAVTNLNADLLDGQHASAFAASSHNHDASNITSGTLPINRGGTGATTVSAAQTSLQIPLSFNYIINGAFDIWQRGTSFSQSSNVYTTDRWTTEQNAAAIVSQQAVTPGGEPFVGYPSQFFLRYQATAAGSVHGISQRIEDVRTISNQAVTVSFYAKASATTTVTFIATQFFGTGGSAVVDSGTTTFSVTTSWQRFTTTFTLPSLSGKTVGAGSYLAIRLLNLTNTTHTIDYAGVQVELGSNATPFKRNANSIQAELSACQRYYQVWNQGVICFGTAYATNGVRINLTLQQQMRVPPTSFGFSSLAHLNVELPGVAFGGAVTALDNFNPTRNTALWNVAFGSNANFGSNKAVSFNVSAANGSFWVSAEL
jgi:hypothetical protein